VDSLALHKNMFSYLTSGMSQAADLTAVLSHATSNTNGTIIADTKGDSLTLLGISPTTLAADASHISFA
jgi:hypothetical protein